MFLGSADKRVKALYSPGSQNLSQVLAAKRRKKRKKRFFSVSLAHFAHLCGHRFGLASWV
jgi:hypothetical protein